MHLPKTSQEEACDRLLVEHVDGFGLYGLVAFVHDQLDGDEKWAHRIGELSFEHSHRGNASTSGLGAVLVHICLLYTSDAADDM
eukprot:1340323-Prymnesium_polylepis.1